MRIAVDLRPLQGGHAKRGIGKYLKNMLPLLFEAGSEHQFILYAWRGESLNIDVSQLPNVTVKSVGFKPLIMFDKVLQYRRARHVSLRILARPRADLFFQPDISYGLLPGIPNAVVLYDLIPLIFEKEYFSFYIADTDSHFFAWKMRDRYALIMRRFERSEHIISISQASLDDLHKFDTETRSIPATITPLAAQSLPAPAAKSLVDVPYFLYVGGNDHRKNITQLVEDFLKATDNQKSVVKLVLVGHDFEQEQRGVNPVFWKKMEQLDTEGRVMFFGYADDRELATLYKHSLAFLFASKYEGFGLPILEAMLAQAPVIAYANSSIPEVAGDAAILVRSRQAFTKAIRTVAEKRINRRQLVARGIKHAQGYTWQATAELTLKALERLAAERD